ncbi:MAG TPA: DinB family protein [Bacteroidia bacterium]
MNTTELLDSLKKDVERNVSTVKSIFAPLSADLLNWKPAPGKWSVGECIEHLNVTDHLYLVRFRKVLMSGRKLFLSRDHYKPSLLGNYFIRQTDPKIGTVKFTAPAVYQPSNSNVTHEAIVEFIRKQQLLTETMEKAKRYDLKKNKIYTPVTNKVRLRFGDALIITVRHDQRHILQALNVMKLENFPQQATR